MALSDDDLLDFDHTPHFDGSPTRLLGRHGDVYRSQLVVARWAQLWGDRMERHPLEGSNENFAEGAVWALREIAAYLRQGDLLPGGTLYEEMAT